MFRSLLLILFFLVVGLTGCDKSYDDKVSGLAAYVSKNKIGDPDIWLAKRLFNGEWTNMVLFFWGQVTVQ